MRGTEPLMWQAENGDSTAHSYRFHICKVGSNQESTDGKKQRPNPGSSRKKKMFIVGSLRVLMEI